MSAPVIGIVVGGILGLLDGLSAWFYPEARAMMITIVIGSTIKGVITGLAAGAVARWRKSLVLGVATGVVVGFILSTLAALGQPDHYWAIVLPGMLVGAISAVAAHRVRAASVIALCLLSSTALAKGGTLVPPVTILALAAGQQPPTDDRLLSMLDPFIGRWQG